MNPLVLALVVGVTGGVGAACRLVVDSAISRRWPHEMATGTLVINVGGSLLAGLIVGAFLAHGLSLSARTIVVTGFCGGLTTWSAAMVESVRLYVSGHRRYALAFGVGGFLCSIGAAVVGLVLVGA